MRAILQDYVYIVTIVEVSVEFADERMLEFGVDLYFPLELLVEGGIADGLLGYYFDGNLSLAILLHCSVDYSKLP